MALQDDASIKKMTSFLKSVTKIRSELDSSLFFLRSRKNVGHPNKHRSSAVFAVGRFNKLKLTFYLKSFLFPFRLVQSAESAEVVHWV